MSRWPSEETGGSPGAYCIWIVGQEPKLCRSSGVHRDQRTPTEALRKSVRWVPWGCLVQRQSIYREILNGTLRSTLAQLVPAFWPKERPQAVGGAMFGIKSKSMESTHIRRSKAAYFSSIRTRIRNPKVASAFLVFHGSSCSAAANSPRKDTGLGTACD